MSALIFVRDGRTLPYVPVTIAALDAIRATCETPRAGGERRSYPHALATYMALLELANDERADRVAVTQRDLAEKAMASREAVQRALGDLQAAGVVVKHEQTHGRARIENEYVVVEPETEVQETAPSRLSDAGVAADSRSSASARPSQPTAAQAHIEKKNEKKGSLARTVTYDGRPVAADVVSAAERLLALFNAEAERRLSARKANGQPTEHLRQIIGALLANPDATFDEWEAGVRRVVADPPSWTNGAPAQLGDIFGPKAAARTLTPPGPRQLANGRGHPNGDLLRALDAQQHRNANTIEGTAHDLG